ncbi:MAG TPA: cation transporter [Candidatus Saccharimonadales bacterium]|nr:cation transporter [Candidatus Saccharimonadales bacterium]
MSEQGHSHVAQFGWATLGLSLFAVFEFAAGFISHNPAMVADAGHNLSDSVLTGAGGVVEFITGRAKSHTARCTVPKLVGVGVCLLTIVLVGIFTFAEAGRMTSLLNPWLIVPVGLASFLLNRFYSQRLHHEHNRHARAWSKHLEVDAYLSLALIPGGLLTYWTGSVGWNIAAAFGIFGFAAWHNGKEAIGTIRSVHRQANHEPDHSH